MQETATVEFERRRSITKFERYEMRNTRLKVHNPKTIDAKPGDVVTIMECKPISKTKHFTITQKLGREKLFEEKQELKQESKIIKKPAKAKVEEKQ